eukprot:GHVL01031892.1.p1 GENE.GHVL01031892.1~~GHVL01031892.1.p1  ORF type:complete len:154 (+),score=45.37 GHVL01031892.1:395-856(+)
MAEEGRARPKNRKSKMSWTEELTFHPRINESSKMLPSPSISDLVDGNICQKFEKIKNKKNQIEEDEEKNLTFRPQINAKKFTNVGPKIRTREASDAYMKAVEEARLIAEMKRLKELSQKEEDEMKECTFQPKTKQIPSFIRRYAEVIEKSKEL